MAETKETRKLCRSLERNFDCLTYPLVASKFAPPGWPDRFIASHAWTGFIEFKSFKRRITPLQKRVIAKLMQKGMNVVVVRFSIDERMLRLEKPYVKDGATLPSFIEGSWFPWSRLIDELSGEEWEMLETGISEYDIP